MINIKLRKQLESFLEEDIGFSDITSESTILDNKIFKAFIKAKEELVVAGLPFIKEIFNIIDPTIEISFNVKDSDFINSGSVIAVVEGNAKSILLCERTALNLLQRLSGIASLTREMAEKISSTKASLVDTRKTTPGLRFFEKYATKVGGATNHRLGLFDSILIKDNHIKVAGSITNAVKLAKANSPFTTKIEVEAQNLEQVKEAIAVKADIVLLDNMDILQLKEAVKICKDKIITEASGNINPETILEVAQTGINYISTGFITHHAVWKDINMKIV
jgi:nicotinate-nucleotide pyrophosphorylase (carboxylating)